MDFSLFYFAADSGEATRIEGIGFGAIGRLHLLCILQERAHLFAANRSEGKAARD